MSAELRAALVAAWGCWAPTLSPDASRVAFISDRAGVPEIWVQLVTATFDEPAYPAVVLPVSHDPVVNVSWSADGQWLACAIASGGGVRTQVWVVRPDGSGAHRVAGGDDQHATLGPWSRRGHRLVVATPPGSAAEMSRCELFDPVTGQREAIAGGGLVDVLDLSADERLLLLRDGTRGAHFCLTLDRELDRDHPLLPYPETGTTDSALLRPSPEGAERSGVVYTAYLVSDAGVPRSALAAVAVGHNGVRGEAGILAASEDGELELIDADDGGRLLMLVWNVAGRSVLELLATQTGVRTPIDPLPGEVVTGCVLARDGRSAVVSLQGPGVPQRLWRLDITDLSWHPLTDAPPAPDMELVDPTLEYFLAQDGLPLTGLLYQGAGGRRPGPVVLSLHGGPEAQERPTFNPQYQALVAAGISVFAPNVRGSSGFGRGFARADDRYGRYEAIADVRSCVEHLVDTGVADPARVAVSGRSYGGYLTLAALVRHPDLFAAGIDICGMSDLLTFFRDTEPWIAAAAVTKYGDPVRDRALLEDLSPLQHAALIRVPLLVIHGEHDTNVPLGEAKAIVAALRAAGRVVSYLELRGEGHEFRRRSSRLVVLNRVVDFLTEHLDPRGEQGAGGLVAGP
jgi:dipeptidyl aminopeptidase/acylaminoacyl peptidase